MLCYVRLGYVMYVCTGCSLTFIPGDRHTSSIEEFSKNGPTVDVFRICTVNHILIHGGSTFLS